MNKKAKWNKVINALYSTVYKDAEKQDIFLSLLGRGYLPREMPPPFNSKKFEVCAEKNSSKLKDMIRDNLHKKRARICQYSLAKPHQLRRVLGIVNPAFYYLVSLQTADLFKDIEFDFWDRTSYSMSFPVFQEKEKNRAFKTLTDWDDLPVKRLRQRAKGKFLVKADISRFFPSIYTHSISWAVHGKIFAKKNQHNNDLKGNILDYFIRNAQDGQTLGIPIGPDPSFIVSEKILFEINKYIYKEIKGKNIKCFHRVDDYEFVCMTRTDADYCIATLQKAVQEFELELNSLKTEVFELPQSIQDPEVALLRNFDMGKEPNRLKLLEYYDLAFECFKKHPKGTLKYSIKRIPTENFYDSTISDFMTQCMLLEPGVIDGVFTWLTKSECLNKIDKATFSSCLSHIIKEHSVLGHTSEVSWAIWGFILLEEQIPSDVVDCIIDMKDSIVLLLALDAKKKKLLKSRKLVSHIKTFLSKDDLYGPHWLLAYEVVKQGWVSPAYRQHVIEDPIFNFLKENGVSFYNTQKVSTYQEIMKEWHPHSFYGEPEVDDFGYKDDEDESDLPF